MQPTPELGSDRSSYEPSRALCWFLAALSCGAGVIHLAMVPQHAGESVGIGLAFAGAGWFQIVFGVLVVARPSRPWVQVALAANIAFVAAWVWSRTVGLPDWTGDAGVESVGAVDALCVAFEIGVVVGCATVLVSPAVLEKWERPALVTSLVAVAGVLVATTAVLAAPSTAHHVHGGSEEHEHLEAARAGEAGDHAQHAGREGHEEGADHHGGEAATDDHHHGESDIVLEDLPADTRAEVDEVIELWAEKYPTAADATAAGWFKATPSLYGIGAHFIKDANGFSVAQPFDRLNPNILLYDGEGPDAKFAGVSYVVAGDIEGFTGPYDFWHAHSTVCMGPDGVTLTEEGSDFWYSEDECRAAGARVLPIAADKMIHLWIGPGYTDAPIFAHDNPELLDGYYPKRVG